MNKELINRIAKLTKRDKKTLIERAAKLGEESGEVLGAMLSFTGAPGCAYKGKTRDDVLEEVADVLILAHSLASHLKVEEEELESMLSKKLDKWVTVLEKDK